MSVRAHPARPSRPNPAPIARWSLVVLALVSIGGGNLLGNLGLFGAAPTGEISGRTFTFPFIPADWAFSIWGFIYPALLALAVAQATRWGEARPGIRRARLPLTVNLVFNLGWLVTFALEWFLVNNLVIVGQFVTGLWLYRAIGRAPDSRVWLERVIRVGVSVYAGWLTVATAVNTTGSLHVLGWDGFGLSPAVWTVVLLGVAAAIGLAFRVLQRDPAYGAVFVWAYLGIAFNDAQPTGVIVAALALAAVFLLTLVAPLFRRLRLANAGFVD